MSGLGGLGRRMFGGDRSVEDGTRVRIAVAAELVELVHVLPEQAALGLRRDVAFHGGDDVAPELLAGDVGREIVLVSRKGAGGRGGNLERRTRNLQHFDQGFPGHGTSPVVRVRPRRDGVKMATEAAKPAFSAAPAVGRSRRFAPASCTYPRSGRA